MIVRADRTRSGLNGISPVARNPLTMFCCVVNWKTRLVVGSGRLGDETHYEEPKSSPLNSGRVTAAGRLLIRLRILNEIHSCHLYKEILAGC